MDTNTYNCIINTYTDIAATSPTYVETNANTMSTMQSQPRADTALFAAAITSSAPTSLFICLDKPLQRLRPMDLLL